MFWILIYSDLLDLSRQLFLIYNTIFVKDWSTGNFMELPDMNHARGYHTCLVMTLPGKKDLIVIVSGGGKNAWQFSPLLGLKYNVFSLIFLVVPNLLWSFCYITLQFFSLWKNPSHVRIFFSLHVRKIFHTLLSKTIWKKTLPYQRTDLINAIQENIKKNILLL